MLIVCPACASEYEIEADRVGVEGRSVRCAACRETWFVAPVAAEPPAEAVSAASDDGPGLQDAAAQPAAIIDHPLPRERPPRRASKPRKTPGKSLGKSLGTTFAPRLSPALAIGLLVCAMLPLAVFGRAAVVRMVPRSAVFFSALGLPVNLRGVEIRDVAAFRDPPEAGRPAHLVVEGDLLGVARERVAVPLIEVELRDGQDRPLKSWTLPAPRAALEPAETARFHASLAGAPAEGRRIEVRFADAGAPAGREPETAAGEAAPAGHGGH